MFDLTGMTALVTGASGGIGSAIAQALAAQGARLAVSGSNADKLNAFRDTLGGDHVALPCNLGDAAAVDALVPSTVDALGGKLDILVNNAGVTRDNLIMRMKDEEWLDVIRINLEANFRRQTDDEGAVRAHHLDHQRRRRDGESGTGQLRGFEGGRYRHDQGAGAGTGEPRGDRKLRRAGLYRHCDDRRFARGAKGSAQSAYPRGAHG